MRQPSSLAVVLAFACQRAPTTAPADPAPTTTAPVASALPEAFEGEGGRFGFRDASGREVLPARYFATMPFEKAGVAFVVDEQGWACIDLTGSVRLRPFVFDNGPDYPSEELFRYVERGRIGFADLACKVVIPAAWEFAGPFAEQRAPVCRGCKEAHGEHAMPQGGSWGFVNRTGREVIAATWDFVYPFEDGVARVERGGLPRRVDKGGNLVPVRTQVRVVELDAADPAPVSAELRRRSEAMAGCADEHQRMRAGAVVVARASALAPGPVVVTIAGEQPADRELATCLGVALTGIVGAKRLVLRIGEGAPRSSRAHPRTPKRLPPA